MNTRARSTFLFALGAIAGCSKAPGMTEDQFCQEYARIECGKVATFCGFSAAACEPIRVNACREMSGRLKTGAHQFNPANTDPCLKALETAYAAPFIVAAMLKTVDDTCARVFAGTAKATDSCAVDFDCTAGLICDKGRCGTERVVASMGGCANIGERCPAAEFCSNDNPSMIFLCARRVDQGGACALSHPCAPGLRCRSTCLVRLDNGGECSEDDDCTSGYCTRYVVKRTCSLGLTFSPESASCVAYMGAPDSGTPVRGTNEVGDGAASDAASSD